MKKFSYLLMAGVLAFFATSCNKSDEPTSANETEETVVSDANVAETVATEVDAIGDESLSLSALSLLRSASLSDSLTYMIQGRYTISRDSDVVTRRLVINFGTNTLCKDGKVRSGKIIISTRRVSDFRITRRTTFADYVVDSVRIGGNITKTITRPDSSNVRFYTIKDSVTTTFPNRGTALHQSDLRRVYFLSLVDPMRVNRISTWGTTSFRSALGNTVTKSIDKATPLVYRMSCAQIVKGIQVIHRNNKTITIDYGNGLCDNIATATNGTKTWTIKL